MNVVKNESGFGLMEVMAAAAIMMIIVLGISSMMGYQQNQITNMKARSEYLDVSNKVRSIATSEASVIQSMKVRNDGTLVD